MQRSDFRHVYEMPVRWGDMDALGHVNNVEFLRYLESGRVAYVEKVLRTGLKTKESVILADIQCAFLQQLHYPATLQVATRVSRMGTSSLHLSCAIFRKAEVSPLATSKAVVVWFDFVRQRPTPVPAAVRDRIYAFEAIVPEGSVRAS